MTIPHLPSVTRKQALYWLHLTDPRSKEDDHMTTFAGWLTDQTERQDAVGAVARLWKEISPGRIHGLAGVTKALQEHSDKAGLTWLPEALQATSEEFRRWKANPAAASVHAPAVATQLDRIEHMLRSVIDALGIPLVAEVPDGPEGEVYVLHDQGGDIIRVDSPEVPLAQFGNEIHAALEQAAATLPYIQADGTMGHRPVGDVARAAGVVPTGYTQWARLHELADHNVAEDAEAE